MLPGIVILLIPELFLSVVTKARDRASFQDEAARFNLGRYLNCLQFYTILGMNFVLKMALGTLRCHDWKSKYIAGSLLFRSEFALRETCDSIPAGWKYVTVFIWQNS